MSATSPYVLLPSTVGTGFVICREDLDHRRTVCSVETIAQWQRFTVAIKSGCDEVAAVHAIDATP